ncbi:cellular morphogenesis protein [Metarhizium album ARSEF 1941]|uniref:Cellular morphogenesis protein n=1 Tax=Metarhizium album (strain ARSEF 1941) TaxID=1081103 RepID=A0A0B2WSL1_METAS|nr:cellular morphogenesis protein [Metarhizium album ARSEF 1941]KHN96472.1 cellular morphogenesis protein [Metarhizium album ARSEF 1941]
MRLSFRQHRPRRPPALTLSSAFFTLAAFGSTFSEAIHFNPAPPANLDFANLGRIAIAGDFNGISLYEYEGQISKPLPTNGSQALLTRLPNGALAPIVSTDASIRAMCSLNDDSGKLKGVVFGGNFTSIDGIRTTAIALFNPNTSEITPLKGLEGEVSALYCDDSRKTVYVGGNFKASNSTNAIAWTDTDGWSNLPFAGFNGQVNAISKTSNGHIVFGGSFTGLGNTSAPNQPDSQMINLSGGKITATNGATTSGFSDPKNIVCSSGSDGPGSTWLAADNVPATWEADFGFTFQPTKLRLYNTRQDGRGTKTFRFLAFPLNGILNFTYVDPSTGNNASCTSECPLSNDPNVKFQDFHFVNRVGMDSFQVAISDWYGPGAGLSGIELFQDDMFAYAIDTFNEPNCKGIVFPSTATSTGPWRESPSTQSSSDYLVATLRGGDIDGNSASVVFIPNIVESGNYSVNMYTPGCIPDASCSTRGQVNVTGVMSTGTINAGFSTTLYQTNYYDKFDQVYYGYIEKSSESFRPTVTLTPLAGQNALYLTVVAQRLGFTLTKSTGGLNSLFDFDPEQRTVDTSSLEKSPINKLGSEFGQNSAVKSLVAAGDTLFIGGNFTSNDFVNAVAIGGDMERTTSPLDGGLNGQVLSMHLEGTQLYVGGSFNSTLNGDKKELGYAAVYDIKSHSWSALGGGVDGPVEHVVPMQINTTSDELETVISLSGRFSQCNAFNNNSVSPADGFAIWVPSLQNWLQNINRPLPTYNGVLAAGLQNVSDLGDLFAGSLTSARLRANGVATLSTQGLGPFPLNIEAASKSQSKLHRRESISNDTLRGVITGAFHNTESSNITVLAGHFTAKSANGSTVNNLIILDGKDNGAITGLGSDISSDSTFITVALKGNVLYAGGMVSGTIAGNQIHGLLAYDLSSRSFPSQPAPISGRNSTVAAIAVRPDTSDVYVGGSFNKAGALGCEGLCIYNSDSGQWFQPGNGLSGEVLGLMWSSKSTLVVAGDLEANSTDMRYLATYDAKQQTWSAFPGAENIPGPVQVMTAGSSDGKQVWVAGKSIKDGSVFLMKYDGNQWLSANESLPARTILRSLQVFSLTKNHAGTQLLGENQALMMTGSIVIPNVGIASAAIFNGTHYLPYALTTNSGNAPGTIARIFTQNDDFFSTGGGSMPLGFVVLIGLAISLGLILLMVVAGIVLDRLRKKREGYMPAPTSMYDKGSGIQRIPPHQLLESLGRNRPGAAPHV